jgi:hypothetical protein
VLKNAGLLLFGPLIGERGETFEFVLVDHRRVEKGTSF